MIEIKLENLSSESMYEKSLQVLENICDEYNKVNHFGTLSMFNQMVCDYLTDEVSNFSTDIEYQISDDEVSINYYLTNGSFEKLSSDNSGENTVLFVMQQLSDELSFSSDNMQLTTSFHVKTKHNGISRSVNATVVKQVKREDA